MERFSLILLSIFASAASANGYSYSGGWKEFRELIKPDLSLGADGSISLMPRIVEATDQATRYHQTHTRPGDPSYSAPTGSDCGVIFNALGQPLDPDIARAISPGLSDANCRR